MLSAPDAAFLKKLPLFAGVTSAEFAAFARGGRLERGAAGTPLDDVLTDQSDSVWIVKKGLLQIGLLSRVGRQIVVDVAKPGDVFGILGCVLKKPFALHIVTLTDVEILGFPREDYRRLMAQSAAFAGGVVEVLARRLAESEHMHAILASSAKYRLIHVMLWLYDKIGPEIPLTRRAIAEASGVTTETAIRMLSPLERSGVIRTRRGLVRVLAPKKLAELALRYP